jgi:tight adherence protein B
MAVTQPWADRMSSRRQKRGKATLADSLAQADLHLRTSEFLLIQLAFLVLGALVGLIRFGFNLQVIVLAAVGYVAPLVYLYLRQGRRQRALAGQLPDVLALLSSGLKAGYSFPQAIDNVARHAQPPVSEEFARVVREMNIGRSPEQALINFGRRAQSDDVDLVITAVIISSQVGGNLAKIIDSIGGTIRDRVRVKRQISALTAQARASGIIITVLPFALATLLYFIAPDYFRPMFTNIIGLVMIGLCLISIGIGYLLIRRIANVEV